MSYEGQTKLLDIDMSSFARAYLIPITDIHFGMLEVNHPKLLKYINWVKDRPEALICGLGDWFETPINRARTQDEPIWPNGMTTEQVVDEALGIFEPVMDRIVFLIDGNHEERALGLTGGSAIQSFVDRANLRDKKGTEQAILKLKVGEIDYRVMAQHGWGGARRTGGQLNKMEEMGAVCGDADVYLTGHEHTLFMARWDKDIVGNGEMVEMRQNFVGCGCFVGYTRFQRRIARRKPNIGAPRVRFNGTKRDVHVSI